MPPGPGGRNKCHWPVAGFYVGDEVRRHQKPGQAYLARADLAKAYLAKADLAKEVLWCRSSGRWFAVPVAS